MILKILSIVWAIMYPKPFMFPEPSPVIEQSVTYIIDREIKSPIEIIRIGDILIYENGIFKGLYGSKFKVVEISYPMLKGKMVYDFQGIGKIGDITNFDLNNAVFRKP